jgi:hypothetical protein
VELDHWLINKREAGRLSDVVSGRQEAGSLVPSTSLELQEMADHPCWGRRFGQGLVRQADEPRAASLEQGDSY